MFHNNHLNQAEKSASLLQLDSLAPYQYLDTTMRKVPLEPEKRLMLAVLEDAIECFQKYCNTRGRKEQRSFAETEAWIVEPGDEWTFSFENICETLGLDPGYLRRGLIQWKRTLLAHTHPEPLPPGGGRRTSQKKRLRMAA